MTPRRKSLGRQRTDVLGSYILTLKTSSGAVADLTEATSVAAVLAPSEGSTPVATLTASVEGDPLDGQVRVTIPADPTLVPGDYEVYVTVTIDGHPLDAASDYYVEMRGGPGTDASVTETDRAQLERHVITELGPLMSICGLSIDRTGSNRDLDPMIGWAYRKIGLTPESGRVPTSDEIGEITDRYEDLADLIAYRVLLACRSRWTQVTTRVSQGQFNETDLRSDLEARLQQMEKMPLVRRALESASSLVGGGIYYEDFFEEEDSGSLHT